MRSLGPLGILGLLLAAPVADAATITGTVTGPDGAPFRGAFVQASHAGLKMTVSVLSDNQGRYVVENLPAGDYRVQVRSVGHKADIKAGVKLDADQNAAYDFALQKAPIRWTDLSINQGQVLLPDARGKKTLFDNCMSCHGFQSRMAATVRDEDGWRDRVTFMREAMRSSPRVNPPRFPGGSLARNPRAARSTQPFNARADPKRLHVEGAKATTGVLPKLIRPFARRHHGFIGKVQA